MELIYFATFFVALFSSILSGIAGGGGSYITAPYWLISGMTPAQGATAGGFMAIGMGVSSLAAFRNAHSYPRNKKLTVSLIILTIATSTIGALTIPYIEINSFKTILAILTIASIPLLFIDRDKIMLSRKNRKIGIIMLALLLLVSSIIMSSAFSILIAVGFSQLFNLTILESTALRRLIGLVQSVIIFSILAWQGNFLLLHAIAGIVGGSIGSYIGTRFAIKKGEKFAKYALGAGALVGAVALLW